MSDDLSPATNTLNGRRVSGEPGEERVGPSRDQSRASSITDWPDGHHGQTQAAQLATASQQSALQPANPPQFAGPDGLPSTLTAQSPASAWYDVPAGPGGSVRPVASPTTANQNLSSVPIAQARPSVAPYYTASAALNQRNSSESEVAANDFNHISRSIKGPAVRVSHLDSMLRAMALNRNGVKKVKIERLLLAAQQYVNARNFAGLHHMRHTVDAYGPEGNPAGAPQRVQSMTYTEAVNSIRPSPPVPAATAPNPLVSPKKGGPIHTPLSFQQSPFYTLETPLASPMFFMRPYSRRRVQQTSRFHINPNLLLDDRNRVYLVSQQFLPQAQHLRPVYFPFYIDITLDDQDVKANTRGVRGSVGSAKPVDLTSYLKAKPGSARSLTVTIHISDQNQYETVSDKSFAMGIYFAQKTPLRKLVSQIKDERPHFTPDQTKDQLHKAAADEEGIESTAMRFSLRDAVMRTRIKEPMRSQLCEHIDCFDAESYFMLQDQAETWKCPVCNRRITYDSLLFDDFFMDILSNTPNNVDAVEISPGGQWSVPSQEEESDSGESGDGDEKPPPSKRARAEPEIEVVDLLSDTDEETPEPVKAIPPRGSFQSGQAPQSPAASEKQAPSNSSASTRETSINAEEHQNSLPTSVQYGQKTDNATEARTKEHHTQQQAEVRAEKNADRANPATGGEAPSRGVGPLLNGRANQLAAENGSSSSAPETHTSDPSFADATRLPSHTTSPSPPPRPPEPRFQIAQMLQSFRGSNSVLFQKSLPYQPGYGLLWGKRNSVQPESFSSSGSDSVASGQTAQIAEPASPRPPPSQDMQRQPAPPPRGERQSSATTDNEPDLSDEEVIDLTGDD